MLFLHNLRFPRGLHWIHQRYPMICVRPGSDEGESIGKVDCGEVFKGMEVVESAGIADGGCTRLYGDLGVVSPPS